jgi:hypothetical protein
MQTLNLPSTLTTRAKETLYIREAIDTIINSLTAKIVVNHYEVVQLWHDVEVELSNQGITALPNETITFDHITEQFKIVVKE